MYVSICMYLLFCEYFVIVCYSLDLIYFLRESCHPEMAWKRLLPSSKAACYTFVFCLFSVFALVCNIEYFYYKYNEIKLRAHISHVLYISVAKKKQIGYSRHSTKPIIVFILISLTSPWHSLSPPHIAEQWN